MSSTSNPNKIEQVPIPTVHINDWDRMLAIKPKPYFTKHLIGDLTWLFKRYSSNHGVSGTAIITAVQRSSTAVAGTMALVGVAFILKSKMVAMLLCFSLCVAYVAGIPTPEIHDSDFRSQSTKDSIFFTGTGSILSVHPAQLRLNGTNSNKTDLADVSFSSVLTGFAGLAVWNLNQGATTFDLALQHCNELRNGRPI